MFKHCQVRFKWDLSQHTGICTLWPLIAVVAMLTGLHVSVAHGQQAGQTAVPQSTNSRESEISTRTESGTEQWQEVSDRSEKWIFRAQETGRPGGRGKAGSKGNFV